MMSCEIHTWTLSAVGVSDYPALPHVRLPIPGHPRLQTDAEVHWNAPVDAETERAVGRWAVVSLSFWLHLER